MYKEDFPIINSELLTPIALLLQKFVNGEFLSEGDLQVLENWKNKSAENKALFDRLENPASVQEMLRKWYDIEKNRELNKQRGINMVTEIIFQTDKYSRPAHRIHFFKTSWFRYAAAVILVFGAAAYFWATNKKQEQTLVNSNKHLQMDITPGRDRAILTLANGEQIMLDSTQGNIVKQGGLTVVNLAGKLKYEGVSTNAEYNTISTPKGGQYQIVLPDGSKVWLNAASSIKFPTVFTGNARQVEVTGEAYMEIAKKPKQSFIVNVRNGTAIQVLGTSFNINAYTDESAVKTTLIEGRVKIISGATSKNASLILRPGQQAIASSDQQLKMVANADIEQALAWKNGTFQFNQTNLAEVMRQLARWYDIEVIYEKGIPNIKLDGDMDRNLAFSQMLDVLSGLGVKFRMEGKKLVIMQ